MSAAGDRADRLRRAAITAAAVGAALALGEIGPAFPGQWEDHRLPLGWLGITPWYTAGLLVALADLALPRAWRVRGVALAGDRRLARRIDRAVLPILGVQALATSMSFEVLLQASGAVPAAGFDALPLRATFVTLLVGGALLTRLLVEVIDRHGLGRGFPLLFVVGVLAPSRWHAEWVAVRDGTHTLLGALLPFVVAGLAAAWLARREPRRWPAAPALPAGIVGPSTAVGIYGRIATVPLEMGLPPVGALALVAVAAGIAEAVILSVLWYVPATVRSAAAAVGLAPAPPERGGTDPDAAADALPELAEGRRGRLRSALVMVLAAPALLLPYDSGFADSVVALLLGAAVALDLRREWHARAAPLVPVAQVERGWELTVALAALDAAGVPAHPRGALFRSLTPWSFPLAPVELLVPPDALERARTTLLPLVGSAAAPPRAAAERA